GVKNQINGQIRSFGKDLITVRARQVGSTGGLNALTAISVLSPLPAADYATVATTNHVAAAVPLALVDGTVSGDHPSPASAIIATSADLPVILNHALAYGIFFAS